MATQLLDAQWFDRVKDAYIFDRQWLTASTVVSKNERTRFLENEVENPVFTFKQDETNGAIRSRQSWDALLVELQNTEDNDIVRKLYEQKVEAQLHRIDLMNAAVRRDDMAFAAASIALYGKPKKQYFRYVAARMQRLLERTHDTEYTDAHKRLEHIFKKIDSSRNIITPEVLPHPVLSTDYLEDTKSVAAVFQSVLDQCGVSGWKIACAEGLTRRIFSLNEAARTIYIPDTSYLKVRKKRLTKVGVQALAAHEIGVHVVSAYNGGRQPLQLLAIGLPGYLRGEEGIATYRQQCIEGASEYYGFDRYLAVALVLGFDGVERDFRGLFEVMQDYYTLILPPTEELIDRARSAAWDVCLRTFRGTTGQSTGVCYTRDINYLEGNIGIWQLLSTQPEWEKYLTIGKYDPLNKTHVEALRALDILPI